MTDVASLVEKRLEKQKERAQYVWQLLSEKPMTAFDVCRALFPSVYEREFLLTMSETIGQLDYLEAIGAVKKKRRSNIYVRSGEIMKLAGKYVVITGASSGIGEQIAYEVAKRGGIPILLARSKENWRKLRNILNKRTAFLAYMNS